MKHLNITLTGKVQRVGFRFSAIEVAHRYDIKGIVMNSGSDAVYLEAEGEGEGLDMFLKWCAKGPAGARIDKVEVSEGALKHFSRFDILSRTNNA
jgi:acylphosphatase